MESHPPIRGEPDHVLVSVQSGVKGSLEANRRYYEVPEKVGGITSLKVEGTADEGENLDHYHL